MKRNLFLAALGLLLSLGATACPRSADRSLTGPAVGDDMVVNGLPLQIQQVGSRDDVKSLTERVEKSWREAGYDVKTQSLDGWQIVSAKSKQCLTTLQLMADPTSRQGSVGFLAISEPQKAKDRAALVRRGDLPLPGGAQVVSSLTATDGPRDSSTTLITTKGSVIDLRDHFVRALEQAGYANVRLQEVQGRGTPQRAQIVSGQRGADIVQVVVFDSHGTAAVINRGQSL